MESLIFLLPVIIGGLAGYLLSVKFGNYSSDSTDNSSNILDELNNRERMKYGFLLIDRMEKDAKDRAERVRQREEK
jgi:hypothetical protein